MLICYDGSLVVDEIEKNSSHSEKEDFRLSADALEKLNRPKDNLVKSGLLTDEKLMSIMSYLDEVETAERLTEIDRVNICKYVNKMSFTKKLFFHLCLVYTFFYCFVYRS